MTNILISLFFFSKIEPSVVEDVKTQPPERGGEANGENLTDTKNGEMKQVSGLLPTKLSVIEELRLLKKDENILTSMNFV